MRSYRPNAIRGAIHRLYDSNERKKHKEQLAEQARLLDLTNDAIIVRDGEDRITYWNKGAEKIYGYTKEEALGKVTHGLLKTEHPEPLSKILEKLHRDNQWAGEIIHYRRDGTPMIMFSRWSLDRAANGKPASILETNTDVTERKAAQKKAAWLALFPENNPNPILELDLKKRAIYYANPPAVRFLSRLQGRGFQNPFFISLLKAAAPLLQGGKEPVQTEIDIDGSSYSASIVPVPETTRLRVYTSNISDRKRAERHLAEAARQRETLYQFVQRRSQAQSLRDIYEAALDAILKALRCDRASLLLLDEERVMRFVDWLGLSQRYRKAVESYSPWKPNAKNPQPVCVADVDRADIPRSLKATMKAEGIRAAAFVPLLTGEKLIGSFMTHYNAPHVFSHDELNLAVTIARQIAHGIQRKRSDEALRESEARMRAIVEQSTVGMVRADLNGRLVFVNEPFCEMLGYKESQLTGKSIYAFIHPDDAKKTAEMFGKLADNARPYDAEKRYVRKDGSVIWVRVSASPVHDAHGKTQSAVAVAVDISSRKKAEAALRRSKQLLEQLVRQRTKALHDSNVELQSEIVRRKGLEGELLTISDREQQRIGQELHDGICQQLTAIGFLTRATALRLKNQRAVEADEIDKIARMINKSVMDARAIARDLHKEEIDAAGFARALRDLAERKIWKTRCRLKVTAQLDLEDDRVASELYRILREALMNANKHARAEEIVLEVCRKKDKLMFSVTDNGIGLTEASKLKQGLGFHIMKYRAQSIGARLEFETPKGGGTRVVCYLPFPK
jgi:PAS domain S-box-containing protein